MHYASFVKHFLKDLIHSMALHPELFVKRPGKDFTRKRKIDFESLLCFLISSGSKSTQQELSDFFGHSFDTPFSSALLQQRDKLLPEALPFLFSEFNRLLPADTTFHGYHLLACDGSDLSIPRNSLDPDSYYQNSSSDKGFNELHLNALYDLGSRTYRAITVVPGRKKCEPQELLHLMNSLPREKKTLFLADRGYESYNVMAHIISRGFDFLIRAKDIHSNGILSGLRLQFDGSFDMEFHLLLTRRQTKEILNHPLKYHYLPSNMLFDFLPKGCKDFFPLSFRAVRIQLEDGTYECLLTSLDSRKFPAEVIAKLYCKRWGIETSYRELKYTIGLSQLHSKKMEHILQEIYAKAILYNFCELITIHVVVTLPNRKHTYQINYTMAIHECKYFFRCQETDSPPDIEALIAKYLLPVREGRHYPRKVKIRNTLTFLYRVAQTVDIF